jgi:hypothetical protein
VRAGLVGGASAARLGAGALLAFAGVALLVVAFLPRPAAPAPDPAAKARAAKAAGAERVAAMWHSTPVERLFPAQLRAAGREDPPTSFTRVGVAPEAACAAVLDPALIAALGVPCRHVLRATYVDSTRSVVATAGVVVLDAPPPSEPKVAGTRSGDVLLMRAYGVDGTPAARFGDRQRISSGSASLVGASDAPYLLAVVVGATDGRPPSRLPSAFDSRSRRETDRAEWRVYGERVLAGMKDAAYAAIQAARSGAAA